MCRPWTPRRAQRRGQLLSCDGLELGGVVTKAKLPLLEAAFCVYARIASWYYARFASWYARTTGVFELWSLENDDVHFFTATFKTLTFIL